MNTDETLNAFRRHFRALWRAEMVIAEIKLGALVKKVGLVFVAGFIALFGLATLNFAAYKALVPIWGDVLALVAVAIGDFVIAGILVALASRTPRKPEIELANELRDQAVTALELDARLAVEDVTARVRRPLMIARSASGSLISIIMALLRSRRNKRED